jgi:two-component system response regulator YesN
MGALDYLLKPVEQGAINLAVEKAVEQIVHASNAETEGFSVDQKTKQLFPDHQHSLMRKLFQEKMFENAYQEICRINPIFRESKQCVIMFGYGAILPLHLPEYPLQLSLLLNRIQNYLETENCGTVFQRATQEQEICVLIYNQVEAAAKRIMTLLREFNDVCRPGIALSLGASQPCNFPGMFRDAYKQAELAAQNLSLNPQQYILPYQSAMESFLLPVNLGVENRIFSALLTGDKAQMSSCIHEWMMLFKEKAVQTQGSLLALCKNLLTLYQKSCDYLSSVSGIKSVAEGGQLSGFSELLTGDWEKAILQIENQALLMFLKLQVDNLDRTYHLSMRVVADWLELNYMKRIRQQDCAKLFHFNKDYMCRRFKEEYGVGMVNYLTQVRINHAKSFLLDTDMQYQEIADAVGIFDSKYFAKLFKRETGQTPAEFRQQRRKSVK